MKKRVSLLLILVGVLLNGLVLCGFVSADHYSVYEGNITYIDSGTTTPVTRLSGDVTYWLNSYDGVTLSETSHLMNCSTSQLSGEIRAGNEVYDIRIPAGADYIEVYQIRSGTTNTQYTWFDYVLRIEEVPYTRSDEATYLNVILSLTVVSIPCLVVGRFLM